MPRAELERLHGGLRPDILFVVDNSGYFASEMTVHLVPAEGVARRLGTVRPYQTRTETLPPLGAVFFKFRGEGA